MFVLSTSNSAGRSTLFVGSLSSFTSLWHFTTLTRCPDLVDHINLIVDNYGTHNHPNVKAWLEKHRRFHLHFTPTSSSSLNLIERWFAELTNKAIRRNAFASVDDLIETIDQFIDAHNDNPEPFVWTANVKQIVRKVTKCKVILGTQH